MISPRLPTRSSISTSGKIAVELGDEVGGEVLGRAHHPEDDAAGEPGAERREPLGREVDRRSAPTARSTRITSPSAVGDQAPSAPRQEELGAREAAQAAELGVDRRHRERERVGGRGQRAALDHLAEGAELLERDGVRAEPSLFLNSGSNFEIFF